MNEKEAIKILRDGPIRHPLKFFEAVGMASVALADRPAGIAAMKELKKRDNGCEFCTTRYANSDWSDHNSESHDSRVSEDELYYHDFELGWEGIKINFCPMCGRRLGGDNHD